MFVSDVCAALLVVVVNLSSLRKKKNHTNKKKITIFNGPTQLYSIISKSRWWSASSILEENRPLISVSLYCINPHTPSCLTIAAWIKSSALGTALKELNNSAAHITINAIARMHAEIREATTPFCCIWLVYDMQNGCVKRWYVARIFPTPRTALTICLPVIRFRFKHYATSKQQNNGSRSTPWVESAVNKPQYVDIFSVEYYSSVEKKLMKADICAYINIYQRKTIWPKKNLKLRLPIY